MAGILDWLLGAQQPQQAFAPSNPPQVTPATEMNTGGGVLHRMGNALLGFADPYGMNDPNAMSPEQRQQGIGMALLNMGTGIASSNARNPLAAVGQGFQYAQAQGQHQGDNRLKGLMYKQQLGKLESENRTKQYLASRPKPAAFGGTEDDWRLFVNSNPAEAFKLVSERPDPNKLITYDANGNPVVNQTYLNAQKDIRAAGRTSVVNNIEMKGEGEFSKTAGKLDAERFDKIAEAGRTAREFKANLDALTELSTRFEPGKMAEWKALAGPYLQALGIKVDDLSAIQSFEGIVDRMAPSMRVPGTGATSDFEMRKFLSALPSLGRTAEGNQIISQVMGAVTQQRIQASAIASKALTGEITRQEANKLLEELPDPLAAWKAAQKSGIATPAPAPAAPPPAPKPQQGPVRARGPNGEIIQLNPATNQWERVQ